MKLDRLGDITSELSTNLVKSIVFPGGFLEWLTRPLPERLREKLGKAGSAGGKPGEAVEAPRAAVPAGPMLLLGGTPVPDEAIVAMIHLAGGRTAKLAVVPLAADRPEEAAEEALRFFGRFGMRGAFVLDLITRERAESPEWVSKLSECQAVFLCGDNPVRGLDVLRGTVAARTLRDMLAAGKPVAGLNAGAAILGERLSVQQNGQDILVDGLGLSAGLIVETQFTQQSRFGRLAKVLTAESAAACMGVGLDAGAAMVVRDGEAKVLGENSATVLDPRGSAGANLPPELKVHVLMDGYGINLWTRKPVGPGKETSQAVNDR